MKVLGILLVALFALAACEATTTNAGDSAVEAGNVADIQVIDFEWSTTDHGSRTLTGTIRNNSDRNMSYVSIEFELTDRDGVTVGSAIDNVGSLSANGTWAFEALVLDDRAYSARIADVVAW